MTPPIPKRVVIRAPSRVICLLLATGVSACTGDTGTQPVGDPATTVVKVSINAARTSVAVGGTLQLSADAANAAGTILVGKPIVWVSSRPDIATITSLGLVKGVGPGTVVITATSGGRNGNLALSVQAPNQITLVSDVGDYIGGGANYSYTKANAVISLSASATAVHLSILGNQQWDAFFVVQNGAQLAIGPYTNATRYPFQGSGAGLDWSGEGRGCNMLTGSFTIDSVSWSGGVGTAILGIDMRFEQHCEGGPAALHGTIHWRSDDPAVPPGRGVPIPTNLWQPPSGATPTTGNFVYLQGDAGEFIVGSSPSLYQIVSVTATGSNVSISAGGYTGVFQGMNSIPQLQVGYYAGLMRYPFHNPALGGLTWFGNGRGCNTLTGWFVVDRVNWANGVLAGIELRFEQHCDGQSAALHGAVRWGQF